MMGSIILNEVEPHDEAWWKAYSKDVRKILKFQMSTTIDEKPQQETLRKY